MLEFQCYLIFSWYGLKGTLKGKGDGWLDGLSKVKANFSSVVSRLLSELCNGNSKSNTH